MGKCRICGEETTKNAWDEHHFMCDSCMDEIEADVPEHEEIEDLPLIDPVKTQVDWGMKTKGYGFYSNFFEDCPILAEMINHLEKHSIKHKLDQAYNTSGQVLTDTVALYIKDWDNTDARELHALVSISL